MLNNIHATLYEAEKITALGPLFVSPFHIAFSAIQLAVSIVATAIFAIITLVCCCNKKLSEYLLECVESTGEAGFAIILSIGNIFSCGYLIKYSDAVF